MNPPLDNERAVTEELIPLVYDELRKVARGYARRQPAGFTLRPTEMVHEACIQLMQHGRAEWRNTEEFRAIAACKIWQVIVDHVRRRSSKKRGGSGRTPSADAVDADPATSSAPCVEAERWQRIPLESIGIEWRDRVVDLVDLADAMEALAESRARLHKIMTLRWFGGLTHAEVARQLELSSSTVEKEYRYALAWLSRRLDEARHHGD